MVTCNLVFFIKYTCDILNSCSGFSRVIRKGRRKPQWYTMPSSYFYQNIQFNPFCWEGLETKWGDEAGEWNCPCPQKWFPIPTSRHAYDVKTEKDPKSHVQHVAIGACIAWSFSPHAAAECVGNFGCLAGWSLWLHAAFTYLGRVNKIVSLPIISLVFFVFIHHY